MNQRCAILEILHNVLLSDQFAPFVPPRDLLPTEDRQLYCWMLRKPHLDPYPISTTYAGAGQPS